MSHDEGTIFNIQRFSIHDGPGVRTTVFFKGCNLRCLWCHNPESYVSDPQVEIYPERCIGCGACYQICKQGAHDVDENGRHRIDRKCCTACRACTETCYAEALVMAGQTMTVQQVMKDICGDHAYYQNSGGGVTFSGGECMLQIDFLESLLKACKESGIHTAVDTAGNIPWNYFERILSFTDLVLYDIKAASPLVHKALTGVDNCLIVQNLCKLSEIGIRIFVRIPFIPSQNDGEMDGIGKILSVLRLEKVEIMPYHRLGESKYTALDMQNPLHGVTVPDLAMLKAATDALQKHGVKATYTI